MRRIGVPGRWAVCLAALAAGTALCSARAQDAEPAGAGVSVAPVRRVVKLFDFEERRLGNFEAMPMHWYRVTGPGYPSYTGMGFDTARASSGEHSVKLLLDGGSAGMLLEPGIIAVVPDSRYRITARLYTQRLQHARARLVATFLDANRQPILATRTPSKATASNGAWSVLSVDMPDAPARAAWLILRLELVQADVFRDAVLGPHDVAEHDIDAAAWFDDVTVLQLPRISVTTESPTNVFRAPDSPAVVLSVHDLTGEDLTAQVTVYDIAGRQVAAERRAIDGTQPGRWTWRPRVPGFGWYRVELRVLSKQGLVGSALLAMSYLPDAEPMGASDAAAFTLIAESMSEPERSLLPAMMRRIGRQSVQLSALRADMTPQEMADAADTVDPGLHALLRQGNAVSIALSAIPREMAAAAGTDPHTPLDLLAHDPEIWRATLEALLASHGPHVRRWQIGASGSDEAFDRHDLAAILKTTRDMLARFVSEGELVLPWSAMQELSPASSATAAIMLSVPAAITPASIPDYAGSLPPGASPAIFLLRTLEPGRYAHDDRAADLALRMIYAWRTGPGGVALDRPWVALDGPTPQLLPDPVLGAWVNVAEQLAGRRYAGRLRFGDGIEADLFDGPRGGAMAVWSDAPAEAHLDLHLGERPVAIDVFGNRAPLPRRDGRHVLSVSPTPRFITGIDMRIARFRAGFAMEPAFVPSVHAVHQRELVLSNPWPRSVSGRLRLTGPARWEFRPQVHHFAIPAGGSVRLPVDVSFPINATAGERFITAAVELNADERRTFDVTAPVTVGLEHIEFRSDLTLRASNRSGDAANDLVLTVRVTNVGESEDSFYAFATVPGQARQQRIIAPLAPGESVVRHFVYPGAADALSGQSIRVGIRQTDGPAILNHEHGVP